MLIYDWCLTSQIYIWSNHKQIELEFYNESFMRFKDLIDDFPRISYKVKIYETIFMYISNRNPIYLLNPTISNQSLFSKCNYLFIFI